ncbi:MAG: transposase family protein [Anaerolineales bacterium]|jgi:hypothetical protein|nr:transposase family protein [Anaerolineales bacterium]MBE7473613.1 transposase family protein [Anaerolineales bacterium]MBE7473827.1 transposase family protein [Anaerolineales bacterium]MBE7474658.1 transposase family protein [Anaerolineales bacterium]MBE7474686.1 transposase family protein [Anaerolineales bacterium]
MIITEETLREDPSWIPLLMGLPADRFWQLVEAAKKVYPSYEQQRHERPDRKRGVGGGRKCDLPLVIRVALVLTYLRLHIIQALVAKFFGASQSDVSRDLRRLLPLLKQVLPCPEVWKLVEAEQALTEEEMLKLTALADGQVLIDATEQQVYRSTDSATRKAHFSGKKRCLPSKLNS